MQVEDVLSRDELLRLECARIAFAAGGHASDAAQIYDFVRTPAPAKAGDAAPAK